MSEADPFDTFEDWMDEVARIAGARITDGYAVDHLYASWMADEGTTLAASWVQEQLRYRGLGQKEAALAHYKAAHNAWPALAGDLAADQADVARGTQRLRILSIDEADEPIGRRMSPKVYVVIGCALICVLVAYLVFIHDVPLVIR